MSGSVYFIENCCFLQIHFLCIRRLAEFKKTRTHRHQAIFSRGLWAAVERWSLRGGCLPWRGKSAPAPACTAWPGRHAALSSHAGPEPACTRTRSDAQSPPPPSEFRASSWSHWSPGAGKWYKTKLLTTAAPVQVWLTSATWSFRYQPLMSIMGEACEHTLLSLFSNKIFEMELITEMVASRALGIFFLFSSIAIHFSEGKEWCGRLTKEPHNNG